LIALMAGLITTDDYSDEWVEEIRRLDREGAPVLRWVFNQPYVRMERDSLQFKLDLVKVVTAEQVFDSCSLEGLA